MNNHSPLPWYYDADAYSIRCNPSEDDTGTFICEMVSSVGCGATQRNAEFIVRACNNYDALLSALEPFCEAAKRADEHKAMSERLGMGTVGDDASTGLGITFRHLYAAREIIAKARRESEEAGTVAQSQVCRCGHHRTGHLPSYKSCNHPLCKCAQYEEA